MNKKRLRVAKKSPMFEKKVIFGIRKFTVGVASVGIATAFLISGTGQLVQAEEVATPSTEITAPINTDQTSDVDATASVAGSELVERWKGRCHLGCLALALTLHGGLQGLPLHTNLRRNGSPGGSVSTPGLNGCRHQLALIAVCPRCTIVRCAVCRQSGKVSQREGAHDLRNRHHRQRHHPRRAPAPHGGGVRFTHGKERAQRLAYIHARIRVFRTRATLIKVHAPAWCCVTGR